MDETGQAPTFDETPSFTDQEDPAAAFLQREQEELGDLGEDSLGFTPGSSNVRHCKLKYMPLIVRVPLAGGKWIYGRSWLQDGWRFTGYWRIVRRDGKYTHLTSFNKNICNGILEC